MEIGKKYYIITHAYWHVVGEVVEVISPRTVRLKNVRFVYSCNRDWTKFFAEGFKSDTTFHNWPDGIFTAVNAIEWNHEIPTKEK